MYSNRMISSSNQVENELIIPRLESIRITRTVHIHDRARAPSAIDALLDISVIYDTYINHDMNA